MAASNRLPSHSAKAKCSHWPRPPYLWDLISHRPAHSRCLSLLGLMFVFLWYSKSVCFYLWFSLPQCSCPGMFTNCPFNPMKNSLAGRPSLRPSQLTWVANATHYFLSPSLLYFPYHMTCYESVLVIAYCQLSQQNVSSIRAGLWLVHWKQRWDRHMEGA